MTTPLSRRATYPKEHVATVPRPTSSFRRRPGRAVVLTVFVTALFVPDARMVAPPPMLVTFNGELVWVPHRATVGDVLTLEGAVPAAGRILDVHGGVIDPGAFPSRLRLNGRPAGWSWDVRTGDAVQLLNPPDQTEESTVETIRRPAGNPQFLLAGGTVTIRRGLRSGIIDPIATDPDIGPPRVALTFDDGPHPRWTPEILDVLQRNGVPATFFAVGLQASRYADLVRREVAMGMTIGDHTWGHVRLRGLPPEAVTSELKRAKDLLASLGATVAVCRPPAAAFDPQTVEIAAALGMRTVVWNVDPRDWQRPPAAEIVKRVLDAVRPGSIVLLHDGGGDRGQTVAALQPLIDGLRARGYGFAGL
jgi:peptidoglycan/xylan/chitin deacetylase (PgdA/CDA1 family)